MLISYEGGQKFIAESRGHRIVIDLPPDLGGTDSGMMPPELLAASLGSCVGVYVANYLNKSAISTEGLNIEVGYEKEDKPSARITSLNVKVNLPAAVPEDRHQAIMVVAKQCLIHNTLHNPPEVKIELV
ncbi:MAG: OsmC family protein [Armatimonadetes bacterium]|nr:OsmC family protein [Armatimonadota bacterium]